MVATPSPFLAGQDITAAFLQSLQPQAWTALTVGASWANVGGTAFTAQYRLINSVTVHLMGAVTSPASYSAGAVIFTLPSGFFSTSTQQGIAVNQFTAGGGAAGFLQTQTNGQVKVFGTLSNSTNYFFNGLLALDA